MIEESEVSGISVFDQYHKLENISADFGWEPPSQSFEYIPEEKVCEGLLREVDPYTSQMRTSKYYAATVNELIELSVNFIQKKKNRVLIIRFQSRFCIYLFQELIYLRIRDYGNLDSALQHTR